MKLQTAINISYRPWPIYHRHNRMHLRSSVCQIYFFHVILLHSSCVIHLSWRV